jgi:hypothetical protein
MVQPDVSTVMVIAILALRAELCRHRLQQMRSTQLLDRHFDRAAWPEPAKG